MRRKTHDIHAEPQGCAGEAQGIGGGVDWPPPGTRYPAQGDGRLVYWSHIRVRNVLGSITVVKD